MKEPLAAKMIRQWCKAQGVTARALASDLDVSEETISRWLSGRLVPSRIARLAIVHVTGVPPSAWDQ